MASISASNRAASCLFAAMAFTLLDKRVRAKAVCSGIALMSVPVQRPQVRISHRSMVRLVKSPYRLEKNPLPILGPRIAAPLTVVLANSPPGVKSLLSPVISLTVKLVCMNCRRLSIPHASRSSLNIASDLLIAFAAVPVPTFEGITPSRLYRSYTFSANSKFWSTFMPFEVTAKAQVNANLAFSSRAISG